MDKKLFRIAIGGIRHETNTFSPVWTDFEDFQIVSGQALFEDSLGWFRRTQDVAFSPTFVAGAIPSGMVRKDAYTKLKNDLLAEIRATLPLDGIYLDLHGAMEVEGIGDGEIDLVTAVRALAGPEALISISLDLHGNLSPDLVKHANILTAFRTAPHRDVEATRARALTHLIRALKEGLKPASVIVKLPLLLTGEAAVTEVEPARTLYARLEEIDRETGIMDSSLLVGCAWTDSPFTSTSIIVVAERNREMAREQANKLAREVWEKRDQFHFNAETATVDEAIKRAKDASEYPVFISDSGDNVTAGAAGDIPLFAERLLALDARDGLVAGLADLEAVHQCIEAGEGAEVRLSIGGKLDRDNGKPLEIAGRVIKLSRAQDDPTEKPTMAVVRVNGVNILLAADRRFFIERETIAAAGVNPMEQKIVVVKQGYLFPDLADHARRAILALSPGTTDLRLEALPYQHLSRPIFPLDPDIEWGI
jgi:microcystin degradation protein MlrC